MSSVCALGRTLESTESPKRFVPVGGKTQAYFCHFHCLLVSLIVYHIIKFLFKLKSFFMHLRCKSGQSLLRCSGIIHDGMLQISPFILFQPELGIGQNFIFRPFHYSAFKMSTSSCSSPARWPNWAWKVLIFTKLLQVKVHKYI